MALQEDLWAPSLLSESTFGNQIHVYLSNSIKAIQKLFFKLPCLSVIIEIPYEKCECLLHVSLKWAQSPIPVCYH